MKKWLAFMLAVLIFAAVHEGAHAMMAAIFGELNAFHVRPVGPEVIFQTPTDERTGIQCAFISGGDVNGIAVGLGIHRYPIQALFFMVMLANRELVTQKLLPKYDVQTTHPLFKPWIQNAS
jgi:hypothetical protein